MRAPTRRPGVVPGPRAVLVVWGVALVLMLPLIAGVSRATAPEPREVAIRLLREIARAQDQLQRFDLDGDGRREFGTLRELVALGLVDPGLGDGREGGYRFEVSPGSAAPELLWCATAFPEDPAGGLHFFTDHSGDIRFAREPFAVDPVHAACPVDVPPHCMGLAPGPRLQHLPERGQ